MTLRTKSPCAAPGCKRACRSRYCAEHEDLQAKVDKNQWVNAPRNKPRNPIYSTARWKRLRKSVLARNPECQADDCDRLAVHVDHIVPMSDGGAAFETNNLQALCRSCHSRKTIMENNRKHAAANTTN